MDSTMLAVRMPTPMGGPENQPPITGTSPSKRLQRRLNILGKQRRKHEQAPDTVNNRGNARQQFDRSAQRAAQPYRTGLGQKQGNPETDRYCDQQCQHRGHHRAVDGRQRTILVVRHAPDIGPQKRQAECLDAGPGFIRERHQNAHQRCQNDQGKNLGDVMKQFVLQVEFPDLPGMQIDSGRYAGLAQDGCLSNSVFSLRKQPS